MRRLGLAFGNSFCLLLCATALAQDWESIEADVGELVERWGVPGVVVGVTRDGEVEWRGAYGVRRQGAPERVDVQTMFDIGSITKCFTATAALMLAEEGRLDLDAPVREVLPELRFPNLTLDRRVSMRDLLSHRTGLVPDNVVFWGSGASRPEVLARVQFLGVGTSLAQSFQYHNVMYLAAGQAVAAVAGESWDDFIEHRVFVPLGMERSRASRIRVGELDNQANPHMQQGDDWRPIPFIDLSNAAPAGSIVSCVDDLLRWAKALLDEGAGREGGLLGTEWRWASWEPQIAIPPGSLYRQIAPFSDDHTYGLGFFLHDYDGREIIEHGGQSDGMHSQLFLVPEEELGIVVLSNGLNAFLPHAICYRILDDILDRPHDSAPFWSSWQQMARGATKNTFQPPSGARPATEEELERWPGSFVSGLYGVATIHAERGSLFLDLLQRTGELHLLPAGRCAIDWGDDHFLASSAPTLTLRTGATATEDRFVLRGVTFTRQR